MSRCCAWAVNASGRTATSRRVAAQDAEIQRRDREIAFKQATIDKITHEMAVLKRLKFAAKSEHFNAEQKSLLEEAIDADLEALQRELEQLAPEAPAEREKQTPKRQPLPANLPRREIRHEPASTTCECGCALQRIGQDVAEKLDYVPGVFTVERHVRGKWVCAKCETLIQAPVPAHIIDKGMVRHGFGVSILPSSVRAVMNMDGLVCREIEGVTATRRLGIIVRRGSQPSAPARRFLDFLRAAQER